MAKKLTPVTPGEFLLHQYMEPFGISQNRLARDLAIPPTRVNVIVNNKTRITPDMALRLAKYFRTTPQYWMNLQQHYDLRIAELEHGEEIAKRVIEHDGKSRIDMHSDTR